MQRDRPVRYSGGGTRTAGRDDMVESGCDSPVPRWHPRQPTWRPRGHTTRTAGRASCGILPSPAQTFQFQALRRRGGPIANAASPRESALGGFTGFPALRCCHFLRVRGRACVCVVWLLLLLVPVQRAMGNTPGKLENKTKELKELLQLTNCTRRAVVGELACVVWSTVW